MVPPTTLRGSFTPIVTPFTADGGIDVDRYELLVDFQIANGSHGIVVNGTTAEPSVLTVEERNLLVDRAVAVAAGRLPVVAATGSQSIAETVALTRAAERSGADAVMVVTPYYIRPPERGLVAYYKAVAAATKLPLLIYHIPGRAGVTITPAAIAEIKDAAPHLVGIKHAANDLGYVTELFERLGREFLVFVGLEELSFPMLSIGAAGLMNAVGNLCPNVVAQMCDHAFAGRWDEARALHFRLFELNRAIFWDTNPIPIKYMMAQSGLLSGNHHRLPMAPATPDLERRLDALMQMCGVFGTISPSNEGPVK